MIPAIRNLQINLQHRFYIKCLNTNNRVQKHSGSLKLSSKYNTITTTTIQGELHILPTDVMPTCPIFTEKTGPTRRSTQEEGLSNPGRTDLLEVSGNTTCSEGFTTTTLSILILSKAYPTMGILSPLPRHASFLAL